MNSRKYKYKVDLRLAVLLLPLLMLSCVSGDSKNGSHSNSGNKIETASGKYPKFEFTKEIHKFGKISEGEIGVCDFYFKNIGESNLIIRKIESGCGCAEFKWKKEPIKVGEESKITIEFNSKGRYGKQYKVITIYSNTLQKKKKLFISANVE
ncbi:DUF1573 domain-containing protein [Marinifilum caeruleilacunae]|uniref:DUF1573 domain-containing protein n=1 Tax=Marinifilum caeruleilacunae TaxID=2499076 RepID=A0ABX1WSQ1_9BACT|nr:DUF1573 domain-containing protein [Marinifilum caeruleilacunae]NOU58954.1 DUF1573 domain-containing protein [Marinifilum caeruleilacunae]